MKLFLDLGTNLGQGLIQFNEKYNFFNNDDWEIQTFEPNPSIDVNFDGIENLTFNRKAIWIKDGTIEFARDVRKFEYNAPNNIGANGVVGELTNVGCHLKQDNILIKNSSGEDFDDSVEVECIDFSGYLKLKKGYDRIIVKMDIEGSEFGVLRHLLRENTISLIDEIYVETHERFMGDETEESTIKLLNEIRSKGVIVHKWD